MLKTTKTFATTLLVCSGALSGFAAAEPAPSIEETLALLHQRIDALEKQIQSCPCGAANNPAVCAPASGLKAVTSSLDVTLYGFIRTEMSYSSRRMDDDDFPARVYNASRDGDDDASRFSATARYSRIGLKINGPEVCGGQTNAVVEVDFNKDPGADQSQGSVAPRLRHAYVKWGTKDGWSVLAGQTYDLIYVVVPDVVNANNLWNTGNLGTRHAQIAVGKRFDLNADNSITATVAAVRPNYSATGVPHAQGSLCWATKLLTDKQSKFSVAGVVGRERFTTTTPSNRIRVWAVVGGVELPVCNWLAFKGFAFTGANLGNYKGCIGQTINPDYNGGKGKAIRSSGGWVQVSLTPIKDTAFNFGVAVDKPKKTDLQTDTAGPATKAAYEKNLTVFGNVFYNFTKQFNVGVEVYRSKLWQKYSYSVDTHKSATGGIVAATYNF